MSPSNSQLSTLNSPLISPGYKQTEVGVIPEEWNVFQLSDHFRIYAGGDVPKHSVSNSRSETHPYPIFSNALQDCGLYGFTGERRSRADSLTITARGYLGHAVYRDEAFFPIVRLLVLEPGGALDARFTTFAVNERVKFAFESTGVPQLTAPQVGKYSVAAPPIPEQRAIAEALSDVDGLLGALDRLIAKKRDLKQAAMQQLLTGQTRLPGFHGEWEEKRLGDVADTDPENLGSETRPDFLFNYIALEDVDRGFLRSHSEQLFVGAPSRARRKLRPNDVLVSTVRPNLQSHLLFKGEAGHWVCSTGFCVVRCREGVTHPGYVFFHLFADSVNRQLDALLTGSNYPAINSGDVRALQIPIPEYAEQTAIAEVLTDMDMELAALEQRREKTRALKQAMMQELLTGRTRLVKAK